MNDKETKRKRSRSVTSSAEYRRKEKKWEKAEMLHSEGGCSLRTIASQLKTSKTSVEKMLKRKKDPGPTGRPFVLTPDEEGEMIRWIISQDSSRHSPTQTEVRMKVS